MAIPDARSGRIVVVSHCILNVHSLEDGLAEFPGFEEDVLRLIMKYKVGVFQLPCPEMMISHISRLPLPKDSYDNPIIREKYNKLARDIANLLKQFVDKGYRILAIIGAEASPTCGISIVGRWKDPVKKGRFPDDVEFVPGMGVFMEELRKELDRLSINVKWIGLPGKTLKKLKPDLYEKALNEIEKALSET